VDWSVYRIRRLEKDNILTRVYPRGGHGMTDPAVPRIQEAFLRDLVEFIHSVPACTPPPADGLGEPDSP
jgi:hypothetical protein